jgi:hypothetical protein
MKYTKKHWTQDGKQETITTYDSDMVKEAIDIFYSKGKVSFVHRNGTVTTLHRFKNVVEYFHPVDNSVDGETKLEKIDEGTIASYCSEQYRIG